MTKDRRPLKSRGTAWAQAGARALAKMGLSPNQISILSIVFSLFSLIAYYYGKNNPWLLILAAVCIQLRLLCNLFDGMVAIEHGKKTNTGDIFNDAPDRFADLFIILGAALAVRDQPFAVDLGWAASAFAIMTAYIRVLGRSLGTESYFLGPMAKPHRMAIITITSIVQAILSLNGIHTALLYYAVIIVAVGSLLTCLRRLKIIIADKERGV